MGRRISNLYTKLVGTVIPLSVWMEGYKLGKRIIKVPAFWKVFFYNIIIYIFSKYNNIIASKFLVISIVYT